MDDPDGNTVIFTQQASAEPEPLPVPLSPDELRMINNTLNEVCHGVAIAEAEFQSSLGWSRDRMQTLLDRIHRMITP